MPVHNIPSLDGPSCREACWRPGREQMRVVQPTSLPRRSLENEVVRVQQLASSAGISDQQLAIHDVVARDPIPLPSRPSSSAAYGPPLARKRIQTEV